MPPMGPSFWMIAGFSVPGSGALLRGPLGAGQIERGVD